MSNLLTSNFSSIQLANPIDTFEASQGIGAAFLGQMTTVQRQAITDVVVGAVIYNTTTNRFEFFQGAVGAAAWVYFAALAA